MNGSTGRAVLDPTLHRAVVEAQRESRVRVDIRTVALEARRRNSLRGGRDGRFDFILVLLADRTGIAVDRPRQLDHRIERCIHGRFAAQPQLLAHVGIVELGFGNQPRRQRIGRFLGKQFAHHRMIRAQPFAHAFERKGQRQ